MMEMGWQKLWAVGNHGQNEGSRTKVLPEEEMNEEKVGCAGTPGHQI